MTHTFNNNISYYVFRDLRASQNNNRKDGFRVDRFDSLPCAIAAFRNLPKEWTSALGIHVDPHSEIDLVQRREGEPVLSGDYQRIPSFYYNPDVQTAVQTLVSQLNIQWQSEYRIFGNDPVLIPVLANLNIVRDRTINAKHLLPSNPNRPHTAIQEIYAPGEGWQDANRVYAVAEQFGYNNPHVPKITTLNVRYTDQQGNIHLGDINPYNYILLLERTKVMEQDPRAIKSIAEAIEHYIYAKDKTLYNSIFGDSDRLAKTQDRSLQRVKDKNSAFLANWICKGDLSPLVEPIVKIIEASLASTQERAEARELLGRILNLPESDTKRLSINLRMRAETALDDLYRSSPKTVRSLVEKQPELGR